MIEFESDEEEQEYEDAFPEFDTGGYHTDCELQGYLVFIILVCLVLAVVIAFVHKC